MAGDRSGGTEPPIAQSASLVACPAMKDLDLLTAIAVAGQNGRSRSLQTSSGSRAMR